MNRLLILAGSVVLSAGVLGACSASAGADEPAPSYEWIHLPNAKGDAGVTTFCDHGNRIYLLHTRQSSAMTVVPASCSGTP